MSREKSRWRLVFMSYPCPTCGAAPGDPCLTPRGHVYPECHADRTRNGDRCPKCGALVSAETPGELCDRCAQVRALEVERATYHRRHT